MVPVIRIARPTSQLAALRHFYCTGLGLHELASFQAHHGFDGVMLGHPQAPYHLEFTTEPAHPVVHTPTPEHLLVFYLPEEPQWQAAVARLQAAGFAPVPAHNPYWDERGLTFADPDGYRVVLQRAAWVL